MAVTPGYTGTPGIILTTAGTTIIPTGIPGITMIPGTTAHGTARGITAPGTMTTGITGPITTAITAGTTPVAVTITGCQTVLPA